MAGKIYQPTVMEVLMKQQGYNQARLGQEVGKDQAIISMIVSGTKILDDDLRDQISRILGLKDSALLLEPYNPELQDTYRLALAA